MKIQIDTTNKSIKVEESVSLKELTDSLEKLLPNGEWKEFTLQTNTVIQNFSSPIVIRGRNWPYWWDSPWYSTGDVRLYGHNAGFGELTNQPYYTSSNGANPGLNPGVYNIEV